MMRKLDNCCLTLDYLVSITHCELAFEVGLPLHYVMDLKLDKNFRMEDLLTGISRKA